MDPSLVAGIVATAAVIALFLGGLVWAYSAGRASVEEARAADARALVDRDALGARLLAEERGRVETLAAEVERLRALAAHRAQGERGDVVALARVPADGDADDDELLRAARGSATAARDSRPGAGAAPSAGGTLVAPGRGDAAGVVGPGPAGRPPA